MRFFFHLHNDLETPDEEGCELPDVEAARAYAEEGARAMAAESVRLGHLNLLHNIEVVDESGGIRFKVTFGDVVEISRQPKEPKGQT